MVSQPDHSSLAIRGSQSVVSSRSSRAHHSSRSKRYNRSHTGGTTYAPQNEFPVFSNSGDVEIFIRVAGVQNRYLLHRHTLTRCSGFFEASTSQEWSKASVLPRLPEPSSRELARIGEEGGSINGSSADLTRGGGTDSPQPRRRWRYELDSGADHDDIPMLVQMDAKSSRGTDAGGSTVGSTVSAPSGSGSSLFGGPAASAPPSSRHRGHSHTHSTSSFFHSVANLSLAPASAPPHDDGSQRLSQADMDLLRDYDNLFRIFYNYSPVLDGINIGDAYVQCKSLLSLADQYDALAVVGPRIDHHLLQFQSRLWKQIAKYPVSYLRLGYLSRSRIIFQEALIHVVGQWPAGERSIRNALPDVVLDIIEDKVDELEEMVSRIEGRLFRLTLTNSRGERANPHTSYIDWLAVSLFRQWLAEHTTLPPQPPLPPPASSSHHHHHSSLDRHHSSRGSSSSHGGHNPRDSSVHLTTASARTQAAIQASAALPSLAAMGRTYRLLGTSPSSPSSSSNYLNHDECKRFLKLSPDLYSRDNLRRFEKRVDELKAAAREVVRPLMGSGLELELERGAIGVGVGNGNTNTHGGGNNTTAMVTAAGGGGRDDLAAAAAAGSRPAVPVPGSSLMSYLTCVRLYERDLPWDPHG